MKPGALQTCQGRHGAEQQIWNKFWPLGRANVCSLTSYFIFQAFFWYKAVLLLLLYYCSFLSYFFSRDYFSRGKSGLRSFLIPPIYYSWVINVFLLCKELIFFAHTSYYRHPCSLIGTTAQRRLKKAWILLISKARIYWEITWVRHCLLEVRDLSFREALEEFNLV